MKEKEGDINTESACGDPAQGRCSLFLLPGIQSGRSCEEQPAVTAKMLGR